MNVTIYDIAEKLQVSHTTVSMALRGRPNVRKETRERILEAAQRMGYRPNHTAVSLKGGRTRRIALVLPELNVQNASILVSRLNECCDNDGYEMVLMQLSSNPERSRRSFELLLQGGYDAAVTYLYDYASVRDLIEAFLDQRRPIVVIGAPKDYMPRPGCYAMNVNNQGTLSDALNMLIAQGHRYIAHSILPFQVAESGSNRTIREALRRQGVTGWEPEFFYDTRMPAHYIRAGYQAAGKLLRTKPETTAIQCVNDLFACGLIRGLQERGVRVPRDISVIGSDNLEQGEFFPVALTTIDLRNFDMASAAWQTISNQLCEPDWESVPVTNILRGNLIVRESTGAVRPDALLTANVS